MAESVLCEEQARVLAAALFEASDGARHADWNAREETAFAYVGRALSANRAQMLERDNVYLGGDGARPYLAVGLDEEQWVVSITSTFETRPALLNELDSGSLGRAERLRLQYSGQEYEVARLPRLGATTERMQVPRVSLVALTNPQRYRTRRYPLNIGRLAQWLRFQHAARVQAWDLALDCDGTISELVGLIVGGGPQLVGFSVNFGELDTLERAIAGLRATRSRPVILVGNVLAAWAKEDVRRVCNGFETRICESYGESELEGICHSMRLRGVALSERGVRPSDGVSFPRAVVLPDERLLRETLQQGGQASLETSFGCQYSRCTFCPRSHRGDRWHRPSSNDVVKVLGALCSAVAGQVGVGAGVVSIVDEDAFGDEAAPEPSIVKVIGAAAACGVRCEIYTRLDQIASERRTERESTERLRWWQAIQPALSRVFVGVESGSESQLARFGKGQSVRDITVALRAASQLDLPLEFGFITFDPLLTPAELAENIEFLSRTDVLVPRERAQPGAILASASGGDRATADGVPLYSKVAYMATEVELFTGSGLVRRLSISHPGLLGKYDPSFARHDYRYLDPRVGEIAGVCRMWTEGTFRAIYRMRVAARTNVAGTSDFVVPIRRYREGTFGLLLALSGRLFPEMETRMHGLLNQVACARVLSMENILGGVGVTEALSRLWEWVCQGSDSEALREAEFRLEHLGQRRDT